MKAIIFDMDGVLFDTERVGDQAWRQAAEEMGFADRRCHFPVPWAEPQ